MARKTKRKPAPSDQRPSAPGQIIIRLELTPDGKDRVQTVADRFGMTQIATLSRLVEWFASHPDEVKRAVLAGPTDQAGPDGVARMVLGAIVSKRA